MEEKLIKLIKATPFMYNKSLPKYKNNYAKEKKYHEIAEILGVSAVIVKKRWRTLKDTYYREMKREHFQSDTLGSRRKRWPYFEAMKFLSQTSSNYQTSIEDECLDATSKSDGFYEETAKTSIEIHEENEFNATPESFKYLQEPEELYCGTEKKRKKKNTMEQLVAEDDENLNLLLTIVKDALNNPQSPPKKSDIENFFEVLGKQAANANLEPIAVASLEMEMLKTFNRCLYNI